MAVVECARLVLYLVEWIWTVVILALFPAQLIVKDAPLVAGGKVDVCLFTKTVGISRCNFGIAWSAIAFSVLTIAVVWHCLDYCTSSKLPNNVEVVIFVWLTLWWIVAGIVFAASKHVNEKGPVTAQAAVDVVIAFSWMLAVFSAISAFIAGRDAPKSVRGGSPTVSSDDDIDLESNYD